MRTVPLLLGILLGSGGGTLLAQYGTTSLRSPMAVESHFQTSLGRENHRFEGAPINKFRLYDFYARQAAHHLGQEKTPELLLPYPGLQGGRQGHWGNSNEPLFSAVTDRTEEPEYHRVMARRGGHFISFNSKDGRPQKALCVLDADGQTLRRQDLFTRWSKGSICLGATCSRASTMARHIRSRFGWLRLGEQSRVEVHAE